MSPAQKKLISSGHYSSKWEKGAVNAEELSTPPGLEVDARRFHWDPLKASLEELFLIEASR